MKSESGCKLFCIDILWTYPGRNNKNEFYFLVSGTDGVGGDDGGMEAEEPYHEILSWYRKQTTNRLSI